MNFNDIVGHKKSVDFLCNLFETDRVPHALLFSGPDGIGKIRLAVLLAAFLSCEDPQATGACAECASCIKLGAGTHPSVKYIGSPKLSKSLCIEFNDSTEILIENSIPENESNKTKITIMQIRELIRESALKPIGNRKKIFILENIDQASLEALNSLLKILEEPPKDTYLFLITAKEELLLPTILSRCQKIELNPLDDHEMKELFLQSHETGMNPEKIDELIAISGGSPGKLIKFIDLENIYFSNNDPVTFFEDIRKWFSGNKECIDKLKILLELEALKFRSDPDEKTLYRIKIVEETISYIKKNTNAELAVSSMFIKMGGTGLVS